MINRTFAAPVSSFSSSTPHSSSTNSPKFGGAGSTFAFYGIFFGPPLISAGVQIYHERKKEKREKDQVFQLLKPEDLRSASFDDVIGHERIKKKFKGWARRIEQGQDNTKHSILLTGEPGTGKSMLVRAFAGRISGETSLLKVNCEALLEKPETVVLLERTIKKLDKKKKPLVLLMDEIGVLGDRTQVMDAARQSTIVRILKIMDGLSAKVAVVGTANNPQFMDSALRNRFPEVYNVPSPTSEERIQLLTQYLEKSKLLADASVDMDEASLRMEGLTGRRIEFVSQVLRNSLEDELHGNLDTKGKHQRGNKSIKPLTFNQRQLLEAIEDTTDPTDQNQKTFSVVG